MDNSLPLFNPEMGTMYTNNITCDYWSTSGNNQVYQTHVRTGLNTIFASPELYWKYDSNNYCEKCNKMTQMHNILPFYCIYLFVGH